MGELMIALQLAVAVALALVLVLRRAIRRLAGPRVALWLWMLPILALLAVLVPGPAQESGSDSSITALMEKPRGLDRSPPVAQTFVASTQHSSEKAITPRWFDRLEEPLLTGWLIGAVLAFLILSVRQWRFVRSLYPLTPAPELGDRVFRSSNSKVGVSLVGLLRTRVVVPTNFENLFECQARVLILDHEREHLRAGHMWMNAIAMAIQILCWCNPLVYAGLRRFRLDQELACDAAVLGKSSGVVRAYGAALLKAQQTHRNPLVCAWKSESSLETRLRLLGERTPTGFSRCAGIALLGAAFAGLTGAGWASHPDYRESSPVAENPYRSLRAESFLASRVSFIGINADVELVFENRTDILIDGHQRPALSHTINQGDLIIRSNILGEPCRDRGLPKSQITLHMPLDTMVASSGRADIAVLSSVGVNLSLQGCGFVDLGDFQDNVRLRVDGDFDVRGGTVRNDVIAQSSGSSAIQLRQIGGALEANTSGGSDVAIGQVAEGGRVLAGGGSRLIIQEWRGGIEASMGGGSELWIDQLSAPESTLIASGSGSISVREGFAHVLDIDQAANGQVYFGGRAKRSKVRNRGSAFVTIVHTDTIDSRGLLRVSEPP
ncbi:MAG: M56 family metallopeptidase [Pseudomonadota bacterium]